MTRKVLKHLLHHHWQLLLDFIAHVMDFITVVAVSTELWHNTSFQKSMLMSCSLKDEFKIWVDYMLKYISNPESERAEFA